MGASCCWCSCFSSEKDKDQGPLELYEIRHGTEHNLNQNQTDVPMRKEYYRDQLSGY